MEAPADRVVLIETAATLPGLLPAPAWRALHELGRVFARDPQMHPSTPYLQADGIEVERLEPSGGVRGINLLEGGRPNDRGLVKALLEHASGGVAYLLGADDGGFGRTVALEAAKAGGAEVEFVLLHGTPRGLEVLRLVEIMRRLRDPDDGCPWDLEQDHRSLARYLIEETYELLDAIESGDDAHLAEELGDVLLQVMFHAQVALDRGAFTIDDVAAGIADKLVRRHPHVFADGDASTPAEVQQNWDRLKAAEKDDRTGPFDGVPRALPALMLADELQRKAAKLGFRWPDVEGPAAKVREELAEVLAASGPEETAHEVGDLLAAVVTLARTLDVDPEAALRASAGTFRDRFEAMLRRAAARGLDTDAFSAAQWLELWQDAKAAGF